MPGAPSRETHAACVGFCVVRRFLDTEGMLLAYIDEIGEPGAFISRDHVRFHTSPSFGYAGFVIEAECARGFCQRFTREKRILLASELIDHPNPGQWEKKGASVFRPTTAATHPQMQETLNRLCTYAERRERNLLVLIDQINEKTRAERLPQMYGRLKVSISR